MLPWRTQALRQHACTKRHGEQKEAERNWQVTTEREAGLSRSRVYRSQKYPNALQSRFSMWATALGLSFLLSEMNSRCSQITAKAHSTSGEDKEKRERSWRLNLPAITFCIDLPPHHYPKRLSGEEAASRCCCSFMQRRAMWNLFLHDKSDSSSTWKLPLKGKCCEYRNAPDLRKLNKQKKKKTEGKKQITGSLQMHFYVNESIFSSSQNLN